MFFYGIIPGMTLLARHRTIWILFILSLILNGFLFFLMITRFSQMEPLHPLSLINQNRWLTSRAGSAGSFSLTLLFTGITAFASLLGAFILNLSFRHSSSQEIFYFQLFLLCLSLLSIRLYGYGAEWLRLPLSSTIMISRATLFLRFSGLLFLLLSGISVFDNRFQKSDPFFLAAVVIAFCLAATIPMSDRFIQNTLTYLPLNELRLYFLFLIIKLIIPINFLWFFYQRKTVDYFILTLATVLCVTGETMLFYMSLLNCAAGILFLMAGTILFSHRIYKLYLWR